MSEPPDITPFRAAESLVTHGHRLSDASGMTRIGKRLPFEKPFEQLRLKR